MRVISTIDCASIFIDECLASQVGSQLRACGLNIELHADHYPQGTGDPTWLYEVGRRGWVAFSKDYAVRRNISEMRAIEMSGLGLFCLSRANQTAAEMASIYIQNLEQINEVLVSHEFAFIAKVRKDGVKVAFEQFGPGGPLMDLRGMTQPDQGSPLD